MPAMGRKPTKNLNLPSRMRARTRWKQTFYYFDAGGKPRKEIPLGSDYALAIKKWAELQIDQAMSSAIITFRNAAERYIREMLPGKAPATQKDNLRELANLYQFFDNPPAPLDGIKPLHIRQYMDWRKAAKTRANREKALFSHIWNMARNWGYTDQPNPCAGIKGFSEKGRADVYIEDDMFRAVHQLASQPLRDALDLAYLTGQRPSDMLGMTETDIKDGLLHVKQRKTGKKLRISIEGELASLVERIRLRKSTFKVHSLHLVIDANGQPFTYHMLCGHFDTARTAAGIDKDKFQLRDIRAKAATDKAESTGDIRQAQDQLGHTTITMTEHYVRDRIGKKVTPTK